MKNPNRAVELFGQYKKKPQFTFSNWRACWDVAFDFAAPQALQSIWDEGKVIRYSNIKYAAKYKRSVDQHTPELVQGDTQVLDFEFLGVHGKYALEVNSLYSYIYSEVRSESDKKERHSLLEQEKALFNACFFVYAKVEELIEGKRYRTLYLFDANGVLHCIDVDNLIAELTGLLALKHNFPHRLKVTEARIAEEKRKEEEEERRRPAEEAREQAKLDAMHEKERRLDEEARERHQRLKTQTLQLQSLFHRIDTFNAVMQDESDTIKFREGATAKELAAIQEYYKIPMPPDLLALYRELGGLRNDRFVFWARESQYIEIESIAELLEKNGRYKSLGLIDAIKHSWGNDRPELDDEELVNKEDIDYFNENYKCFGLCRLNGGLEEAYYFYFDKNHQFGWVRYHQDEFGNLWDEHLTEMLEKSPAKDTLEEFLTMVLDALEKAIMEDGD